MRILSIHFYLFIYSIIYLFIDLFIYVLLRGSFLKVKVIVQWAVRSASELLPVCNVSSIVYYFFHAWIFLGGSSICNLFQINDLSVCTQTASKLASPQVAQAHYESREQHYPTLLINYSYSNTNLSIDRNFTHRVRTLARRQLRT